MTPAALHRRLPVHGTAWAMVWLVSWGLWKLAPSTGSLLGGAWTRAVELPSPQTRLLVAGSVVALGLVLAWSSARLPGRAAWAPPATVLLAGLVLATAAPLHATSEQEVPVPIGDRTSPPPVILSTPLAVSSTYPVSVVAVWDPDRSYTPGEAERLLRLVEQGTHLLVADDSRRTRHLLDPLGVRIHDGHLWPNASNDGRPGTVMLRADVANASLDIRAFQPRSLVYANDTGAVDVLARTEPVIWDADLDGRAEPGDSVGHRPVAIQLQPPNARGSVTVLSAAELSPRDGGPDASAFVLSLLPSGQAGKGKMLVDLSVTEAGTGPLATVLRVLHEATGSRVGPMGLPTVGLSAGLVATSIAGVLHGRLGEPS